MDLVDRIQELFARHGGSVYAGERREPVTALQHALQCAHLAERAQASPALVAAALLHDVGHFIEADRLREGIDDVHEMRAVPLLAEGFGPAVVEPVRLHVQAKRYLVSSDLNYIGELSSASIHTLRLQGGPMCAEQCRLFETLPHANAAVMLRRWDDLAKRPRARTPPLAHYLPLLRELVAGPRSRRNLAPAARRPGSPVVPV